MSAKHIRAVTAICAAVLLSSFSVQASAEPSNKWRIEFDHSTDADSEFVLRFAPEGGAPIDVTTKLPKGTTENQAAQLTRKSLKAALGKGYNIDVDDFEDVLVKKKGKTPKFDVSVASSTVTGLTINLKRE
jgi:hypothetical protein